MKLGRFVAVTPKLRLFTFLGILFKFFLFFYHVHPGQDLGCGSALGASTTQRRKVDMSESIAVPKG